MAALDGMLAEVRSGSDRRLVLVRGEAGVGKAALLRRFVNGRTRGSSGERSSGRPAAWARWSTCASRPVASSRGSWRRPRGRMTSPRRSCASCASGRRPWSCSRRRLCGRGDARRDRASRRADRGGARALRGELPRRRARSCRASAPAAGGAAARATQACPAVTGRRRAARRAARRRRRRARSSDGRQPVLRHGGADGPGPGAARHRARGGPGACGATLRAGAPAAGRGRDRAGASQRVVAGGARRRAG